jgi:sec-independent protein translocase protein TatB
MQMFGVGILELLVVLILAAIVVGPERMPQVAADLARWIRRARAYGQHLTRDFNEVIGELERETGATREDWKEIASVVTRHTSDVTKEIEKVTAQVEKAGAIDGAEAAAVPDNVVPFEIGRAGEEQAQPLAEAAPADADAAREPMVEDKPVEAAEAKPWFVPETPTRRRRRT